MKLYEVAKDKESKRAQATAIYLTAKADNGGDPPSRKDVSAILVNDLKMTPAAASTYFQNVRHQVEGTTPVKRKPKAGAARSSAPRVDDPVQAQPIRRGPTAKDGDGNTIAAGDWVDFKYDMEQSAQIHQIKRKQWGGGYEVILKRPEGGWSGEYLRNQPDYHTEDANRVYKY